MPQSWNRCEFAVQLRRHHQWILTVPYDQLGDRPKERLSCMWIFVQSSSTLTCCYLARCSSTFYLLCMLLRVSGYQDWESFDLCIASRGQSQLQRLDTCFRLPAFLFGHNSPLCCIQSIWFLFVQTLRSQTGEHYLNMHIETDYIYIFGS